MPSHETKTKQMSPDQNTLKRKELGSKEEGEWDERRQGRMSADTKCLLGAAVSLQSCATVKTLSWQLMRKGAWRRVDSQVRDRVQKDIFSEVLSSPRGWRYAGLQTVLSIASL